MENLTCELNGIKYLLMSTSPTTDEFKVFKERCERHGAIVQGYREINRSFFYKGYVTISVLVPEKNVMEWNKEELSEF